MKKIILFAGLLALVVSCNQPKQNTGTSAPMAFENADSAMKDGLFIHLSHGYDDVDRASMALSLAVKMADSVDVIVFCDLEAVTLLTKDAKHPAMTTDHYMCPKDALDELRKMGVTIRGCPMCMKNKNIKPEDLANGVTVAARDKFFSFTKGRILTLDY